MNKPIGIIGHFGGTEVFLDGQTVKTKTLYQELIASGIEHIVVADTWLNGSNKAKLLIEAMRCITSCDKVSLIVSRGGLKVFLPKLYWAKRLLKKQVYLDIIGGNTAKLINENPSWLGYLKAFDSIWAETRTTKAELLKLGLSNVEVIPNFKRLDIVNPKAVKKGSGFRFCMFSRVMPEKGVLDAIEAVAAARQSLNREDLWLDIWGPIAVDFKDEFKRLCDKNSFVTYRGCVDFGCSAEVLCHEHVLLFPTRWEGEGFPGTIIDAYAAGLPVVASDWNSNAEIVKPMETGLIYPASEIKNLNDAVAWCVGNEGAIAEMANRCVMEANGYLPDAWITRIRELMGLGGRAV